MKVETYEIEEINASDASKMAADSEAIELIEKLDLAGQRSLINKESGSRIPYREMTALEGFVFGLLFPNQTKLKDYSHGIIPVRVLQIAAYARELNLFKKLAVWHPAPGVCDPLLCGFKQSGDYEWNGTWFLLARWGDALESFEQLTAKARDIWVSKTKNELTRYRRAIDDDLAGLAEIANEAFLTGKVPTVSYNGLSR